MRIRITRGGIFNGPRELQIGEELTVPKEPIEWAGRYEIIADIAEGAEPVTNPKRKAK